MLVDGSREGPNPQAESHFSVQHCTGVRGIIKKYTFLIKNLDVIAKKWGKKRFFLTRFFTYFCYDLFDMMIRCSLAWRMFGFCHFLLRNRSVRQHRLGIRVIVVHCLQRKKKVSSIVAHCRKRQFNYVYAI